MATTIDGKKPATTKSGHRVVLAPQLSKGPALTPAGVPVPTPYAISGGSHSAKKTSGRFTIAGAPVLTTASYMDVDPPGNAASKATGGDVLNAAACGVIKMIDGSMRVFAGGKGVVC
ncbi:MAG TPA: hypothetical protein ENK23_00065, partial [Sorangium sp.]|nr:hypothetical protein [Sorangium sp.]